MKKNYILLIASVLLLSLEVNARAIICYEASGNIHCFLHPRNVCPVGGGDVEVIVCENSYSIGGSGIDGAVAEIFEKIGDKDQADISEIYDEVKELVEAIELFKLTAASFEFKVLVSNNELGMWKSGKAHLADAKRQIEIAAEHLNNMTKNNLKVIIRQVEKNLENASGQLNIATESFSNLTVDANFEITTKFINGVEYYTEKNLMDGSELTLFPTGNTKDENTIRDVKVAPNPVLNKTVSYSFESTSNQSAMVEVILVGSSNPPVLESISCTHGLNNKSLILPSGWVGYCILRIIRNNETGYLLFFVN